ncbi:putative protein TPRXL isoform X2 [Aplysia californica]|uniref:Uncharacterized protein n=1 Tax=Aplysia californica TaxID=6500 RepID=A0ABM1VXX7_APLCA|nr:putative protein TPRXL isoform X2 [Aplysia californica]
MQLEETNLTYHPQTRPRSLCARCSTGRTNRQHTSPGRAAWVAGEKGRGLSIEREGREGRSNRRRHASASNGDAGGQRSPSYCYVVPLSEGANGATSRGSSSTTYREDFKSPRDPKSARDLFLKRQIQSNPSSPVSSSPWATSPSSPATTPSSLSAFLPSSRRNRSTSYQSPSRNNVDVKKTSSGLSDSQPNFRRKTTYTDHYTWLS